MAWDRSTPRDRTFVTIVEVLIAGLVLLFIPFPSR
jgi:hypothetical protein